MVVLLVLGALFIQIVRAAPTPSLENLTSKLDIISDNYKIENVEIETNPTNSTINWTTTVGTKSYIEYYPEENFTMWGIKGIPIIQEPYNVVDSTNEPSPTDYPYILNHSMTLTGLKPNTTYVFRVKAKDIYDFPEYYESNFTTAPVYLEIGGRPFAGFDIYVRDIWFQDLSVTPEEINYGENVTIQFNITNKGSQEKNVGFIIEHHPPAYLIIHDENMTLPYFQYAKSISLQPNQKINYKYTLRTSNYYPGVNTIIINYLGSKVLAETFTVTQPQADYTDTPSSDIMKNNGVLYQLGYGLLICSVGIIALKFYKKNEKVNKLNRRVIMTPRRVIMLLFIVIMGYLFYI